MRHAPPLLLPVLVPVAAFLAGCPADEPVDSGDSYTPAPYIFEEDAPPEPSLEAADLEGAIEAAVATVYQLNAGPIFPAYLRAMEGAEETCPSYYANEGNVYWYDQCTAASGANFSGYSFYYPYVDYDAGDGGLYNGASMYGVAEITTADGYTFSAGGSAYDLVVSAETYTYYYSVVAGAFAWDGPEAEGTWLAEGVAPDLTLIAYDVPEWGSIATVDGGLSGFGPADGTLFDAVVFDAVTMVDPTINACSSEPGGVVSVRDADGGWYDVVFDGPATYDDEVDPALCDGCGAAYFRGEFIGDVCADFSTLLDWEVSPW